MAKQMNDVHDLIDSLVQQAAHEGWEDREVYSGDIIRLQNELREKYAALQSELAAAREALKAAEADAARYVWLRDSPTRTTERGKIGVFIGMGSVYSGFSQPYPHLTDEVVDMAMRGTDLNRIHDAMRKRDQQ